MNTPVHWCMRSTGAGRLNRHRLLDKSPTRSCAHTARSAAALWDPGRGHSGLETENRSSSLSDNELVCSLDSTVPSPPGLGWPLDMAGRTAHST